MRSKMQQNKVSEDNVLASEPCESCKPWLQVMRANIASQLRVNITVTKLLKAIVTILKWVLRLILTVYQCYFKWVLRLKCIRMDRMARCLTDCPAPNKVGENGCCGDYFISLDKVSAIHSL